MTTLVLSIFNGSSLFLQIRWATIKVWMSMDFVKIISLIIEKDALEHL